MLPLHANAGRLRICARCKPHLNDGAAGHLWWTAECTYSSRCRGMR